jgi:hypothetical protein
MRWRLDRPFRAHDYFIPVNPGRRSGPGGPSLCPVLRLRSPRWGSAHRHDLWCGWSSATQGIAALSPGPGSPGTPRFVTLENLVSLKLDRWVNSPSRRLKDKADVIELIKARNLPRELAVDEPVRDLYRNTWDALEAECT